MIERFAAELETSSLRGNPRCVVRTAIYGWNAAADTIPGWPQQRLTPPAIERQGYVLPADSFPLTFRRSLDAYLAFLADPPEDDDAPLRGLRPTTLKLREFQFRQTASALVHRGTPAAEITSITDLVTRDRIDAICDFFAERSGRPNSVQVQGFLAVLRPLALHQLKDRTVADWIVPVIQSLFLGAMFSPEASRQVRASHERATAAPSAAARAGVRPAAAKCRAARC